MKEKFQKLFQILNSDGVVYVTDQTNQRYLTGFDCDSALIAATPDSILYVTDFRYLELAEKHFAGSGVNLKVLPYDKQVQEIQDFVKGANLPCFIEDQKLTLSSFRELENTFKGVSFKNIGSAFSSLRTIKTAEEIACIEKAQGFAEKAFNKTLHFIKPGVTEREIMTELEYQMLKLGAEHTSFETIIASGVNSSVPHAKVTDKKIENGEFITMDFGAKYKGYCSDMTRTVFVGKPKDEHISLYNLVLKAQKYAVANIRAGITGKEADSFAREIITANGYGDCFGHGLGHGVGLDIHEAPRLNKLSEEILKENMIVTAEPGIYIKNSMGVRIEDMLVVKEGGNRNLTSITTDLITL